MVEGITAPGSFVHLPASTERTMEVSSRLSYKGYQAWIKIDGKESQCYSTDVDHAKKTVTCWIASEAGKTFSIGYRSKNFKASSYRVTAHLDGTSVGSGVHSNKKPHYFSHVRSSKTTQLPFMFSVLQLTDDDDYLEATPQIADVGEIKIIIQNITDLKRKSPCNPLDNCSACACYFRRQKRLDLPTSAVEKRKEEKVHERSKKAILHRISYGDEQQLNESIDPPQVPHYKVKDILMTFIFRYRSLDVLQANEIAPHTSALAMPSQDSSPSTSNRSSNKKRKVIGDVQESVKGFEDRENALLAELAKLKDEKEQFLLTELEKLRNDKYNENAPRKKVKTETKSDFPSAEFIDLT